MGVNVRDLSPSAQKQVLQKLLEEGKRDAKPKYGNKKVTVGGIQFDSKKEARRYLELDTMAKAGLIQDLCLQVKYELIPSQRINGKVVEREVAYVADFVYEQNGETVVEDTKGVKTKDYIIKRKLMLFRHGIKIKEI